MHSLSRRIALVALTCLPGMVAAQSSVTPPVNLIQLVSAASVAGNPVPPAQSLTVSASGSYTLTLTDLKTPAALQSLQLSIATPTQSVLVLSAAGSQSVMLQSGVTYTVQVLAVSASAAFGSFSVQIVPAAGGNATCQFGGTATCTYADAVGPPSTPLTGTSTYSTQVSISQAQAGSYTLTLTDDAFPVPLQTLELIAVPHGVPGPTPVSWQPSGGGTATPTPSAGTYSAALAPGTYDVFVVGIANSSAEAGLYGVKLASGSNTAIATTQPVGLLPAANAFQVPSSEMISVLLNDLATPSSLTTLQGVVTQGASSLGMISAGVTSNVAAVQGAAQLFVWAQTGGGSGQGAYGAYVSDASGALAGGDIAQPVLASGAYGYAFATPIATTGQYTLYLSDFQVPIALGGVSAVIVQQAASLGALTATGKVGISAATGTVHIIVLPQLAAATDDSLFGLTLTNTQNAVTYQATQGVGAQFSTTTVTIANSGSYIVQATDLQYPRALNTLDVIVTQGQALVGSVLGSSALGLNNLTAGTYVINVLASVGTGQSYGQYGLVFTAAPVPTVTLTAQPMSVMSGQQSTLSWSSTNATSCTATGGVSGGSWGGNIATSGSQQTGALTQTASFTITCTGEGGSADAMAQVTVTAASGGSGSGGGAWSGPALLALLVFTAFEMRRRQRVHARS